MHELLERVRSVPGVRLATTQRPTVLPAVPDRRGEKETGVASAYFRTSADYFRTMGIPILRGRDFGPGDNDVVIVNEAAATALWPADSAVGQLVKLERDMWRRVIGVSRNAGDPEAYAEPQVFVASAVDTSFVGPILFRTDGSGPEVDLDLSAKRFLAGLFLFLGACSLGLAALGLYGVLAYVVSRRTREFGIRIALGATQQRVFRMVLHDGAVMFLAGTAIGAFTALAMAQLVDALLYRVGFSDVWSLITAELVLCGVALVACLGPARRAMRANPLEIIRAA
jgi:hypothetical protein